MRQDLPEPLQDFGPLAGAVAAELREADDLAAAVRAEAAAGRLPANSIEAVRVELTYHSNAIEGNTLTLRQTQLVVEGHAPGGDRPLREIDEARNHDRALRRVERLAADRSGLAVDEAELLAVHAEVLRDIDDRNAGRLRTERVLIAGTGHVPPGGHRFGELIPRLLAMTDRDDVHPVLRAAELHYNLAAVHPFADGNGRTARLMMNHLLLACGYPLAIIRVEDRGRYLRALDDANRGDLAAFGNLVVHSVVESARRIVGD